MITAAEIRDLSVNEVLKEAEKAIINRAKALEKSESLMSYPWDKDDDLAVSCRKRLQELGYTVVFAQHGDYNYTSVSW